MGDGINVETGGLSNFSKEVHADTDVFLEPARDRANVQFQEGIRFGQGNASEVVLAAKARYALSLGASQTNLTEYVKAARLLANAAEKVAAMLNESDARAAKSTEAADKALYEAWAEARAAFLAVDGNSPRGGQAVPQ
ncbi:hypothetical protein [Actinoplanes sp. TFC3]|uniref:hypothetical protein n=1 Tax=Actinoplanes sp. TFC3 TaxID=1710355 RepID=UPI0008333209|nr:hypothetical protein [Actinoplanes sp. TFC3]